MSRLPAVSFPGAPAAIPAQEAVAFNDAFLVSIAVDVTNNAAHFCWRRYNYDRNRLITTREAESLGIDAETVTHVPDLWTEAARYPLVAQVVGGLLTVADAVKQLLVARPVLAAAQATLTPLVAQHKALTEESATAAVTLTQNNAALAALPEDASEEDRAAAQEAADIAQAVVTTLGNQLAALVEPLAAAQAAVDAAQPTVTAIETALGA